MNVEIPLPPGVFFVNLHISLLLMREKREKKGEKDEMKVG